MAAPQAPRKPNGDKPHVVAMSSHQDMAQGPSWFHPVKDFAAGTVGGFAGKTIEYPFDTVKVRMQTAGNGSAGTGALAVVSKTLQTEGMRGLYKGMALPLFGTILETSCLFMTNGLVKKAMAKEKDEELSIAQVLMAGGVSGFAVSFILTPIELVKCRLQVSSAAVTSIGGVLSPVRPYAGPLDCLTRSIKADGLAVVYRGHVATMLREIPGTAGWFGAYEVFARAMTPPGKTRDDLPALSIVGAGALGGMAYWGAFYPADTVKSAQQTVVDASGTNNSFSSVFARIYRTQGIRGLYRGLTPTLCRAAPANAAVFLCYEICSRALNGFAQDWLV